MRERKKEHARVCLCVKEMGGEKKIFYDRTQLASVRSDRLCVMLKREHEKERTREKERLGENKREREINE